MARRPTPDQARAVFDRSDQIMANVRMLASAQVLVGVPQQNAGRDGAGPSNALLAYIHENGAPEQNIPARPFLKPGIRDKLVVITRYLRNATTAALAGDQDRTLNALRAAGQTGATGAQARISAGLSPPLSERTIIARLRKTQAGQTRLRRMRRRGEDVLAWGQANMKPLLDTGQLRRAITYVVKLGGKNM